MGIQSKFVFSFFMRKTILAFLMGRLSEPLETFISAVKFNFTLQEEKENIALFLSRDSNILFFSPKHCYPLFIACKSFAGSLLRANHPVILVLVKTALL